METIKHFFQRLFRGWDDRETWDMEDALLKWFLPRAKRYRKISLSYPANYTQEQWDHVLGYLIYETEDVLDMFAHEDYLSMDDVEKLMERRKRLIKQIQKHLYQISW